MKDSQNPNAILISFPQRFLVVLDRIEPGQPEPDYCIHGKATCVGPCKEWVYLGHETHDVVARGEAAPMCVQCATKFLPEGTMPVGRVSDHKRADGPHE